MRVLFLLVVLFSFTACGGAGSSGSSSTASDNWVSMDVNKETNSQDQLVAEGYKDGSGVLQGPQVSYHARKGLVKSIAYYIDGKKNGPYITMTESGSVQEKSWFKDDVQQGERVVFNRTRVKEKSFYKDGELHGDRKLYYDNGKIQEEGAWVDGKRDGVVRWYNQDEEITIQYEYKNGEKVREVPIE